MDEVQTPAPPQDAPEDGSSAPVTRAELAAIHQRLDKGSDRMTRIEGNLAANTEITREIRDIVLMGRTFFRGLRGAGRALTWVWGWLYPTLRAGVVVATAVSAIGAAIYSITHGGQPPQAPK
jgi:hypothetical protein